MYVILIEVGILGAWMQTGTILPAEPVGIRRTICDRGSLRSVLGGPSLAEWVSVAAVQQSVGMAKSGGANNLPADRRRERLVELSEYPL